MFKPSDLENAKTTADFKAEWELLQIDLLFARLTREQLEQQWNEIAKVFNPR